MPRGRVLPGACLSSGDAGDQRLLIGQGGSPRLVGPLLQGGHHSKQYERPRTPAPLDTRSCRRAVFVWPRLVRNACGHLICDTREPAALRDPMAATYRVCSGRSACERSRTGRVRAFRANRDRSELQGDVRAGMNAGTGVWCSLGAYSGASSSTAGHRLTCLE